MRSIPRQEISLSVRAGSGLETVCGRADRRRCLRCVVVLSASGAPTMEQPMACFGAMRVLCRGAGTMRAGNAVRRIGIRVGMSVGRVSVVRCIGPILRPSSRAWVRWRTRS